MTLQEELALGALRMALAARQAAPRLVQQSDRQPVCRRGVSEPLGGARRHRDMS
ncbi:MAG: hypothetical protein ABI910_08910 [Gemmatimonadota bacterium]